LFAPAPPKGNSDAVEALARSIGTAFLRPAIIKVNRALDHFVDAIAVARTSRPTVRRAILFAHPSDGYDGFLMVSDGPGGVRVTARDWWLSKQDGPLDLLVAHVCFGASVLRKPHWQGVFREWISYDGLLEAYMGSAVGQARWASVAADIIDATVVSASTSTLLVRMRHAYERELVSIVDNPDWSAGDSINLCNFERALKLMTISEEAS
jgi:hypothetical protein